MGGVGLGAASSGGASPGAGGAAAGGTGGEPGEPKLGAPYPVVLAHGFFGFEEFAGIDFVTYFFEVKEHLVAQGEPNVFTTAVDPFNSSDYRGAQLLDQIEDILEETGHEKVIIIGHSQGGLDARVVASLRPDLVDAAVLYATPNRGTRVADAVLGLIPGQAASNLVDWLVNLVARPLYDANGKTTSLSAPMELFSEPGIADFNARYPDATGVKYYSLTGRSDRHRGGTVCDTPDAPPFVTQFDAETDPIDPLFALPEALLDGSLGVGEPNDGLVTVSSAKWGTFLGCLPADHLDEIGHLIGDNPGFGNQFDHKDLFVDLIAYLRARGH